MYFSACTEGQEGLWIKIEHDETITPDKQKIKTRAAHNDILNAHKQKKEKPYNWLKITNCRIETEQMRWSKQSYWLE